MNAGLSDWQLLSHPFNQELKEVMMQQYFAAQYIAMAGRYLVPQREDDSNTSMIYDRTRQQMIGEKLKGEKRLALHLSDLTIRITEIHNQTFHGFSLEDLTRQQAYEGLKRLLDDHDIEAGNLNIEMHYDLPDHPLSRDSSYHPGDSEYIRENIIYRHNAEVALGEVLKEFAEAEPVRIWPHHFDTGSLIPMSFDEKGDLSGSIGVGWAMPDGMIDEPYYYLSLWTKDPLEMPDGLSSPGSGTWVTSQWNGAVLRLSDLLKYDAAKGQHTAVVTFFNQGLQTAMEILKS